MNRLLAPLLLPALLLTAVLATVVPPRALAAATPWVPMEIVDGHMRFPVQIGSQSATATLDSSRLVNGISNDWLARHGSGYPRGRQLELDGMLDRQEEASVSGVKATLFGGTLDLDNLLPGWWGGADLMLGLPFFSKFTVQIDYPNHRLRLIERGDLDLAKVANVRMNRDPNGTAMVQVDLGEGYKPWLTLDTGHNGGVLVDRSVADAKGWLANVVARTSYRHYRGDDYLLDTMTVRNFTFGPIGFDTVQVQVPADGNPMQIEPKIAASSQGGYSRRKAEQAIGRLGYDVLQHFLVTIDYRGSHMHIAVPELVAAE